MSLVEDNIRQTPPERLKQHSRALRIIKMIQKAGHGKRGKS